MAEFEYFACRHAKDYPALFMAKNYNELEIILNAVMSQTIKDDRIRGKLPCVKNLWDEECEFLKTSDVNCKSPEWLYRESQNSSGQVHPKRILKRHKIYLGYFLSYLESLYSNIDEEEREKMKNLIKDAIRQYEERIDELEKKDRKYMDLR